MCIRDRWVRNAVPNVLVFSDDAGTDWDLNVAAAGGIVTEDADRNIVGGTNAGASFGAFAIDNTVIGYEAGATISANGQMIALGNYAANETTSANSIAIGYGALRYNTSGNRNIGIGIQALAGHTTLKQVGADNIGIGHQAMYQCQTAINNVVIGNTATNLTSGDDNVCIGDDVATAMTAGSDNVILGSAAAVNFTNASGNVVIGKSAGPTTDQSNQLWINNSESDTPLIHGDFATPVVTINGDLDTTGGVDKLRSATTAVSVSAATAPTTDQVLTATSSTTATWQTPTVASDPITTSFLLMGA